MIDIIIFILLTISFVYAVMIIVFALVWQDKKNYTPKKNIYSEELISIVVATRNEKDNIEKLIKSISQQTYGNFELIIINDHSDDDTYKQAEELAKKHDNFYVFNLPTEKSGKKDAVYYGASKAKGGILFFTDADCVLNPEHVETMYSFLKEKKLEFVAGPVEYMTSEKIINKLFQLEFLSLIGSGAAGFFLNTPFMCNAANLMLYKNVFINAFEKTANKHASGDDVFLLHYLKKRVKTAFVKSKNCIVKTVAPKNLEEFVSQRVRWAGKSKSYKSITAIFVAILSFLMSLSLIVAAVLYFYFSIGDVKLLYVLFAKLLSDFALLFHVLRFHNKLNLVAYIPLVQIVYPFYIVTVSLMSFFVKPIWKNRKIQ